MAPSALPPLLTKRESVCGSIPTEERAVTTCAALSQFSVFIVEKPPLFSCFFDSMETAESTAERTSKRL